MTRSLFVHGVSTALAVASLPSSALAGDFDATGRYVVDPAAVAFEACEAPVAYIQEDAEPLCSVSHAEPVLGAADALEGDSYVRVSSPGECIERFTLFGDGDLVPEVAPAPNEKASYKMTAWMRHGGAGGRFVVRYTEDDVLVARLAPTGRATSDGWIELESNPVPIDGTRKPLVYLRFTEFATEDGVDLDAIELVRAGEYREQPACSGVADEVCGPGALCVAGQCRLGALSVPPLPRDEIRPEMVASMRSLIETFYGGRNTRLGFLQSALATFDEATLSDDAWTFWNGWATAIRRLHDWHTNVNSSFLEGAIGPGLNVCFIEGDADRSQFIAPKHPVYPDILVSHTGSLGTAGLSRGDRLVAVDGLHPIEWAQGLDDVNWSFHPPCDPESYSDYAEDLGRSFGLIARYAKSFTVVRCNVVSGTCADELETIQVADLPAATGQDVGCDNRPFYHLADNPGANHFVGFSFFQGPVLETTPEEAIYGMIWDTLYGGGDPNGYVNGILRSAITDWKANARGVILDHRAGSGGTLDAPQYVTELVRPQETWAVALMPTYLGSWNGPETPAEGIELFDRFKSVAPYVVGSPDHDPDLPVALLTHRDGSASDYLPEGMKGAPKTRLFGPGPTAGAFSTFIQFSYWGGISFQLASGDTIRKDGIPLIGRGVIPDEIVEQRQSDLLAGRDSIHEAALAWVRSELKQP